MNKLAGTNSSKRSANLELLRILSMAMIITLHYLLQGGVLEAAPLGSLNYYIVWVAEALCYVSVNCFVLISGYFLVTSRFKWKRFLELIFQVLFYSIAIYLVFCLAGVSEFQLRSLLSGYLFPLTHGQFWFITAYLALYLIFPFLNILIHGLTKTKYLKLLLVLFVLFSFIPTVFFFSTDIMGIKGGYSLGWFVFLYLIGGYIRLYRVEKKNAKGKNLLLYFAMTAAVVFAKVAQQVLLPKLLGTQTEYWDFYRYNSVFVLIGSVALFLFFLKISIKKESASRWICAISSVTFGIFLIHTHYVTREWIWDDLLKPYEYADSNWLVLHLVGSVVVVFVACGLLEKLRYYLFRLIRFDLLLEKLINVLSFIEKACFSKLCKRGEK